MKLSYPIDEFYLILYRFYGLFMPIFESQTVNTIIEINYTNRSVVSTQNNGFVRILLIASFIIIIRHVRESILSRQEIRPSP